MIEWHRVGGHEVRIELIEVAPARFRWAWSIDGAHSSRSANVILREDEARSEAFLYAQVAIARIARQVRRAPGVVAERE